MVLPRPTAFRGFSPARVLRASVPRTASRAVARRSYASGHGSSSSGGDLPWALGATAITLPSVWYLWPDSSHGDAHGPGDAHAKHLEEHPNPQEESKQDEPEPKDESSSDDSKDEKKGGEKSTQDQPQSGVKIAPEDSKSKRNTDGANMPESKGDVEGVSFKGPTSEGDSDNKMPDERKREPDGKGAFKKRIDSGYGKNLNEGPQTRDDGSDSAANAKPSSKSSGDISNKQAGISNTPTRHSTDITQDPNMSKKGEGGPDTAKSMGTISVNRPTPEGQKDQKKGEEKENNPNPDAAKKDE